jgi:hypothetical protein
MAIIALTVAVPAVAYFLGPLRRKPGAEGEGATFQDVGPLSDIPVGQWRLLSVDMVHQDGWKKTHVKHAATRANEREKVPR